MIKETTMLYLYVETPLHAGVGSGLSSIDLPIQRERATQYPIIQGSGIKGKLRALAEDVKLEDTDVIFGSSVDTGKGNEHAGAIVVGDARILLFPIRSLNGVFAYATSYDVLNRFKRDIERRYTNQVQSPPWSIPIAAGEGIALVTTTSEVIASGKLVLEEFSFTAQQDPQVDSIAKWVAENTLPDTGLENYWGKKLTNSLVVLPDDDFRDFVLYATEVITRIRIDREKKTVQKGALWSEEHLPTDTLMYVPIYATDSRKAESGTPKMTADQILQRVQSLEKKRGGYLQLGGDETVGRGIVRIHWEGKSKDKIHQ